MNSSLKTTPAARTFDIEDLVKQAWSGAIRVPHFQRDFRWNWEDVRRLFDSMVRGYPLGSLPLWSREAPAAQIQLGSLTIDAPAARRAFWVVDGQQRLTSIANALHPDAGSDSRFALSYDLRRGEFVKPPKNRDPHVVPVPVLFDLQEVILWFANNREIAEYLDDATRVTKTLRQYEMPVYIVETDDVAVLQDIFDRMNNYGKRLTRAEIFTALNADDESYAEGSLTLEGIASNIDEQFSFGIIDNDTVLAAVLARRGPEVRRDIRKEFDAPTDEGLELAYSRGEEAIKLAVQFLQEVAGVPHYSFVAYRYLLVVLTRLFALHPSITDRDLRLLRRWYWQAAVLGPEQFKGGTPNAARILCSRIDEADTASYSIQRLLQSLTNSPRVPNIRKFAASDAGSKILLCALWSLNPRDPTDGEAYTYQSLTQALVDSRTAQPAIKAILPRALVSEEYRPWAANRVLVPGLSVDSYEVSDFLSWPTLYISDEDWHDMLRSHCLDEELADMLRHDMPTSFLEKRQQRLESHLAEFLAVMCEWDFENTPPLSVFDLDDPYE